MAEVGKVIGDDIYVHLLAVECLHFGAHRDLVEDSLKLFPVDALQAGNVAKVNLRLRRVSLLEYLEFETNQFPVLSRVWTITNSDVASVTYRSYAQSTNPPILHRKELLVARDHPARDEWCKTTESCTELGLFDETKTIGFLLNWERSVAAKGFRISDNQFVPIGNDFSTGSEVCLESEDVRIQRHLTALSRTALSAPVQLLLRHGLLESDRSFFDYGCGRGNDIDALASSGYIVSGWDPHYASDAGPAHEAYAVNLGFVVNVIEDPAERVEALHSAFRITKGVLSIGVMLYGPDRAGKPYRDGFITARGTFQKYFTQDEIKDYIEQVLQQEAFMVAPGIAFVFADKALEQQFVASRYRTKTIGVRMLLAGRRMVRKGKPVKREKSRIAERRIELARPILEIVWRTALELGRYPEIDELPTGTLLNEAVPTLKRAIRLIGSLYDADVLDKARQVRVDDLQLYFAMQRFAKRPRYRQLETRLQRDVVAFFGDYQSAQSAGIQLLTEAANVEKISDACRLAAEAGFGWLDGDLSLQLHIDLIERLPAVLRAYFGCALILVGGVSDAQLVKFHINSGKLTLMEFDDFDVNPLPRMSKRIKVNLRVQAYESFEYGVQYPKPLLYRKSHFLHEDSERYAEQIAFDESLDALGLVPTSGQGPAAEELELLLNSRRLDVYGMDLLPSRSIPPLESACGANFTYRDFVECGETQKRLSSPNVPKRPETYNALCALATHLLDPLIDYYGAIVLTYGFCSRELGRMISAKIAPELDQHASEELKVSGAPICSRGGAACDFLVEDEDMREVARWVMENLPFDRLYFYGSDRPLHVSWSSSPVGKAYEMATQASGRRVPRAFTLNRSLDSRADFVTPTWS